MTTPMLPSYQPGRPRVEWSRRRVQNLLLSLGVLLLTVAALIFIAVNWGTLGAGGRVGVLAVVTLSAAAAATVAARRALPATAESVAVLTVALLTVDSVGLRLAGLASGAAPATYASAASAAIALLVTAWLTRVRLRALGLAALLAAELVLPLATGTSIVHPAGVAAVYGLEAAALIALRFHVMTKLDGLAGVIDIRVLRVSTYIWWAFALTAAAIATYGSAGTRSAWGPFELLALAAIAVWAAGREAAELHLALAVATGIAAACGVAPHLDASWRAPAVEAAALFAAVVVLLVPTRVARASTAVVAAVGLGALLTAAKPIAEALAAPGAVAGDEVWKSTWAQARSLHATDALRTGQPWSGSAHLAVLGLTALAAAVLLVPRTRVTARKIAVPGVAALVVGNLILVPLEAAWPLPAAVAWELAVGAALLIAAAMKNPENITPPAILGACFLAHAGLWSLRSPALTVVAVAVTLAASAIAARVTRYQTVLATAVAALVGVEAALIAAYQGATFEQTGVVLAVVAAALMAVTYVLRADLDDTLAAALQAVALVGAATAIGLSAYEPSALTMTTAVLLAATAPAIVLGGKPLAPAWPALVQALICLEADAVHRWAAPNAGLGSRALILVLAAATVSVAANAFQRNLNAIALITGPTIYALAVSGTIATHQLDPVWLALFIGGGAAAMIAAFGAVADQPAADVRAAFGQPDGIAGDLRAAIHVPAAISFLLLLASSWVRLAESHVHSVDPYTVPAAVILLAAGNLRRRTDREAASWPCYGPGLIAGLAPTLIQALADPGLVRPALLGVASLLVLIAGIRGRLQAPLAVGACVLVIDVIGQLSPALAAAYDAVPRWTLIAMAGALLLVLGVTYERRIRDVRALGRKFGELR
ncbi:hypothetical protein KGQ20_40010 [Catenulispora sp. NF23]|uniref:SCO7613 C-terminal domain-containing membrane protein n=1 Tax=Catenulispora pinistramenti TaxID=2705254 RepID=UPI001BACE9B2|nr:hypothetical protein [Catenulispora pinistramenti]MBS2538950.1 hypothetical protein [Catenulispora pinistramenti]